MHSIVLRTWLARGVSELVLCMLKLVPNLPADSAEATCNRYSDVRASAAELREHSSAAILSFACMAIYM